MSPQGASARMEAQILLYLQEQAKAATEKKQQKTNQKEAVQKEVAQKEAAQKEVEKEVATMVSSCRLYLAAIIWVPVNEWYYCRLFEHQSIQS